MITAATSIFFAVYKLVDALGNADFLLQKLGFSEGAARFLGSPRTIDVMIALSFIGLVLSLVYQLNRLMVAAQATPAQETIAITTLAPLQVDTGNRKDEVVVPERIFVNVAPEYLMGFYKEYTGVQAEKLAASFIGKWIKVTGRVEDVHAYETFSSISFEHEERYIISMSFDPRWNDHLSILRRKDTITVIGQIERVFSIKINLTNCELVGTESTE